MKKYISSKPKTNRDAESSSGISIYGVRNFLLGFIFFSVCFVSGYYLGNRQYEISYKHGENVTIFRDVPEGRENLNFSLFWEVWDTLEEKYYDTDRLKPRDMVYGAIRGMVDSVGDPYTVFLDPEQNKVVREDLGGSFEGVGIQIGFKGNQLSVIAPLEGSPGKEAGLMAGDYIVGLRDDSKDFDAGTSGISLQEAVRIIRGEKGTRITFTIIRDGVNEPIEIEVNRASIDVPTLSMEILGEGEDIAHVKLSRFGGETAEEWEQVVVDVLKNKEVDKIILDVRNNPGGFLQGAQDLGSEFLEVGDIVVIEQVGEKERIEHEVERLGRFRSYKTVVLVNPGSASASEILAGALRDNLGTRLIGETTFGKGTIQEPQEIEGGEGLHITIAKWLTPNGTWVNDVGLEPDIAVEDNPETEEDEQLQKAIEFLNGN